MSLLPKQMDLAEFGERGFMLEINRRFLNPLGLVMVRVVEKDGSSARVQIWDYSDDPEGVRFGVGDMGNQQIAAATEIAEDEARRRPVREALLGYWVQPLPAPAPADEPAPPVFAALGPTHHVEDVPNLDPGVPA